MRSRAKALDAAQELLTEQVSARGADARMALTNALAPEETWTLGARLSKAFETSDFYVSDLGPVLGVHVGPGTIGAAVMPAA